MLYLVVLASSLVVASLAGHVIHWLLHQRWTGPAYKGHMEHHVDLYPPGNMVSDRYRAAKWYRSGPFLFTPPFVLILAAAWLTLRSFAIPHWVAATFGLSMLAFALFNDYVHDAFHLRKHWLNGFRWFRTAKVSHFVHHKHMRKNFGIASFAWDRAFGTFKRG